MIDLFEYCKNAVLETVAGKKTIRANKIIFRCPFCGDSAKHRNKRRGYLYKNDTYPSYFCFKCSVSYSTYKFLSELLNKTVGEVKKDIAKEYSHLGKKSLLSILSQSPETPGNTPHESVRSTIDKVELLDSWEDLSTNSIAEEYIKKRRVLEAPYCPKNWKLYFDIKTKRLVIPWIRKHKVKYWQARSLNKTDDAKYLFPKDTEKDLFGLDEIDSSFPYIFLLEGAFDSMFVKNGIAIGGLDLTEYQKGLLEHLEDYYEFIYFTDNPWNDEASKKNIFKLIKINPKAKFFCWDKNCEGKDVNDMVLLLNDLNKYTDENYLKSKILSGPQLKLKLLYNR